MIASLNHLWGGPAGGRGAAHRRIRFVHAARHGGEHAFRDHLRSLVAAHPDHLTVHVRYSAPRPDDVAGRDFQASGRLDREALRDLLPLGDYDVYLCGPAGFMTDMRAAIEDLGLRPEDRKSTRLNSSH